MSRREEEKSRRGRKGAKGLWVEERRRKEKKREERCKGVTNRLTKTWCCKIFLKFFINIYNWSCYIRSCYTAVWADRREISNFWNTKKIRSIYWNIFDFNIRWQICTLNCFIIKVCGGEVKALIGNFEKIHMQQIFQN